MAITCTKCDGTGFMNIDQIPVDDMDILEHSETFHADVLRWIQEHDDHDVQVCDCCGDGEGWYGTPGEHYNAEDPIGKNGPYASNGGLCKCH